MGDIAGLAASIREVGLLHPIVVRPNGELIAGERRLAACRALGWKEIPATVVDLAEVARGEAAENFQRKDFTPSEAVAIKRAIEPLIATPVGRPPKETPASCGNKQPGETTEKAAAFTGYGARTLEKAEAIVSAAKPLVWPAGRYALIYADPPWRYEHPPIGASNRSIENHYPPMGDGWAINLVSLETTSPGKQP